MFVAVFSGLLVVLGMIYRFAWNLLSVVGPDEFPRFPGPFEL